MTNESEKIEQVFERCTSTDFSSRDREEILRAMQEYADLQLKECNHRLADIIDSMHKPEYATFFIGDDQIDGYQLAERLKKGKV